MASTVVGLFDLRDDAQTAVQNLINAGFDRKDISIVAADAKGEFQTTHVDEHGSLAGEGAASGATSGALVGGVFGLLVGVGALAFPAIGLVAIGPLAGLLTGAGIGAVSGGIIGALIGLGIPEEHADVYAEGVRRGGTLVSVYAGDGADTNRIETILDDAGAVDINERGATWRSSGYTGYDANAPYYTHEQAEMERTRYQTNVAAAAVGTPTGTGYAYADNTPATPGNGVPGVQTGGYANDGTSDTRGIMEKTADTLTGDNWDDKTGKRIDGNTNSAYTNTYDSEGNPTLTGNGVPGIQTGGRDADGTPDTRGIMEKTADAVTGDKWDDKTGKRVD
ncbi:hypothetical protein BH11ARM2_BH11ARM2_28200 [soil metagenome]